MSFESETPPIDPRENFPQPPEYLEAISNGLKKMEVNIQSVNQGLDVLLDRVSGISEPERAEMLKPLYRQIEGDSLMHGSSVVFGFGLAASTQVVGVFESLLVALGVGAASLVGGKILARQFAKLQTFINKDLEPLNVGE